MKRYGHEEQLIRTREVIRSCAVNCCEPALNSCELAHTSCVLIRSSLELSPSIRVHELPLRVRPDLVRASIVIAHRKRPATFPMPRQPSIPSQAGRRPATFPVARQPAIPSHAGRSPGTEQVVPAGRRPEPLAAAGGHPPAPPCKAAGSARRRNRVPAAPPPMRGPGRAACASARPLLS